VTMKREGFEEWSVLVESGLYTSRVLRTPQRRQPNFTRRSRLLGPYPPSPVGSSAGENSILPWL
jgi:hypothetical protein